MRRSQNYGGQTSLLTPNVFRKILVPQETIDLMDEVQNDILGPEDARGPKRPVLERGTFQGGVQFERNKTIKGVKDTRCYTIAQSFQFSRNLVSPVAAGKVMENELDDNHVLRKKITQVCGTRRRSSCFSISAFLGFNIYWHGCAEEVCPAGDT